MLWNILQAYGGKMPDDGKVIFCNTGKERPQTLDFIERVSQQWDVEIIWLEFRLGVPNRFVQVDYATASRKGEPFDDLIRWKQCVPNVVMRFCTQWLKLKVSNRYVRRVLGWKEYTDCVGLRADEPRRVAKLGNVQRDYGGCDPIAPMAKAKHTLADVEEFWSRQPFRLELEPHEGNCDLCFLKGQGKLLRIMKDSPDLADWWIEKEKQFVGKTRLFEAGRFRKAAPSYAASLALAQQPGLFDLAEDDLPDCRCTD